MYTFIAENESGEQLRLTQNENYEVESITGLGPAPATINTSVLVNMDGEEFNSSRINMRNLVITVLPKFPIEANRLKLYKIFRSRRWVKCFYKNSSRNVFVEGLVESVDPTHFENPQKIQISIVCPQPMWKSVGEIVTDISKTTAAFEFPFSIDSEGVPFSEYNDSRIVAVMNHGDLESGLIIDLYCDGNEVVKPKIYDADTGEYIEIDTTFSDVADSIRIDTNKKTAYWIKDDTVVGESLFNYIDQDSVWLKVRPGVNFYYYTAESGAENMSVRFKFRSEYEGV